MSKSDELARIINQHRHWLKSGKTAGKRADLSGAHLDGIDFSGADLSGAIMVGASLKNAVLAETQLIHANLVDTCLQGAVLTHANLLLTDFTGADLKNADLSYSTTHSDKSPVHISRGPQFKDADLRGANLHNSYHYISDFSGANLSSTDFSSAILERANLSNNDLSGVNLSHANLLKANLRSSDLSNANLEGAELTHADLQETTLSNANVCGANLQSANFAHAKVDGIRCDRKTRFKGIRVNSCYGSARFRRYAEDQDFIEEFKEAHPYYFYVWLWSTDCGRSMLRVVIWSLALTVIFGLLFYSLGEEAFNVSNKDTLHWTPFTTIYYSVVTFTTLGFGDITPRTQLAATLVMMEVITGYTMLGILISIIANKVARRS